MAKKNKPMVPSVEVEPQLVTDDTLPAQAITQPPEDKPWIKAITERAKANRRHPLKIEMFTNEAGEVIPQIAGTPLERACTRYETTGFADAEGAIRLLDQVGRAQPCSKDEYSQLNSAASIMNGIGPETPLEGLLAAQMTAAHNLAMEFSRRAMVTGQTEDGVERNINRATKMMRAFTSQVEALQKLRNKGQQNITVQHVQVNQGGQAVIGDVNQGGQTP